MSNWYFANGNIKKGPMTIEQLKLETITNDTLIWKSGMTNWQKAIDILELKNILLDEPPPLPPIDNPSSIILISNKPQTSYNLLPFVYGFITLILYIIMGVLYSENWYKDYDSYLLIINLWIFIFRFISLFWCGKLAERLNRNNIFCFFIN
jgi:hypothetical protein